MKIIHLALCRLGFHAWYWPENNSAPAFIRKEMRGHTDFMWACCWCGIEQLHKETV